MKYECWLLGQHEYEGEDILVKTCSTKDEANRWIFAWWAEAKRSYYNIEEELTAFQKPFVKEIPQN